MRRNSAHGRQTRDGAHCDNKGSGGIVHTTLKGANDPKWSGSDWMTVRRMSNASAVRVGGQDIWPRTVSKARETTARARQARGKAERKAKEERKAEAREAKQARKECDVGGAGSTGMCPETASEARLFVRWTTKNTGLGKEEDERPGRRARIKNRRLGRGRRSWRRIRGMRVAALEVNWDRREVAELAI